MKKTITNQRKFTVIFLLFAAAAAVTLTACGGGGGGGGGAVSPPAGTSAALVQMGGSLQGATLALKGTVSTLAGAPLPGADGVGGAARFDDPNGVVSDGTHLFVADTNNHTIRKIVLATGAVSTLAGTSGRSGFADAVGTAARFDRPRGITTDGTHLFVSDTRNYLVRKVNIATGAVTTLAGTLGMSGSLDGAGTAASFSAANGLTTDGSSVYLSDNSNHTIRKIVIASGLVTTLAGSAGQAGTTDAMGAAARFNVPSGIFYSAGTLFVTELDNHTVRKIVLPSAEVSTVAGTAGTSGSADGVGTSAAFRNPYSITGDANHLFVTDTINNTVRKIVIATGQVTTLAGTATVRGPDDGTGATARFYFPSGISMADGNTLYVADTENQTIRKITVASAAVTTLAGVSSTSGATDEVGVAARFNSPGFATTDGTHVFVSDTLNHTIRRITITTGAVTTVAGNAGVAGSGNGVGSAARFREPAGIVTDAGNLYVADYRNHTIRKIVLATGAVTTLAGTAGTSGNTDGTGATALLTNPYGLTTNGVYLFVSSGNSIRQITLATGAVATLAGDATVTGSADGVGAAARFNSPVGLTVVGGDIYVADLNNYLIRKINIGTRSVSTVAGQAGVFNTVDGTGTAANFGNPIDITSDGTQLFVTQQREVRKIVLATGAVTTLVGETARLSSPRGVTTDGVQLFVVDATSNSIVSIR